MSAAAKTATDGRARLLDAARACFCQLSYDQVGVAQILQGAGVQAPTLYHHYGDKEGLYVQWALSELAALSTKLVPTANPAFETSSALRSLALVLSTDVPFDLRQLLKDTDRLQRLESKEAVLAAYLESVYNPLYAILVRGSSRGELREEPVGLLAETFIAGALAVGKHGWRSDRSEECAAWWTNMFLHGCSTSHPLL